MINSLKHIQVDKCSKVEKFQRYRTIPGEYIKVTEFCLKNRELNSQEWTHILKV